jgi:hypothetical protein
MPCGHHPEGQMEKDLKLREERNPEENERGSPETPKT